MGCEITIDLNAVVEYFRVTRIYDKGPVCGAKSAWIRCGAWRTGFTWHLRSCGW